MTLVANEFQLCHRSIGACLPRTPAVEKNNLTCLGFERRQIYFATCYNRHCLKERRTKSGYCDVMMPLCYDLKATRVKSSCSVLSGEFVRPFSVDSLEEPRASINGFRETKKFIHHHAPNSADDQPQVAQIGPVSVDVPPRLGPDILAR